MYVAAANPTTSLNADPPNGMTTSSRPTRRSDSQSMTSSQVESDLTRSLTSRVRMSRTSAEAPGAASIRSPYSSQAVVSATIQAALGSDNNCSNEPTQSSSAPRPMTIG